MAAVEFHVDYLPDDDPRVVASRRKPLNWVPPYAAADFVPFGHELAVRGPDEAGSLRWVDHHRRDDPICLVAEIRGRPVAGGFPEDKPLLSVCPECRAAVIVRNYCTAQIPPR